MVLGNTFFICIKAGLLAIWVKATYNIPFHRNRPMMTVKRKEKMINNSVPIMEVIISAKSDMGKPIITARLRMFL
jgi:hypothetical protein